MVAKPEGEAGHQGDSLGEGLLREGHVQTCEGGSFQLPVTQPPKSTGSNLFNEEYLLLPATRSPECSLIKRRHSVIGNTGLLPPFLPSIHQILLAPSMCQAFS